MIKSKVVMDIDTLRTVTGYAHWIPITQALHEDYFSENFPGWEWNDFVPRLLEKKILKFNEAGNPEFTMLSQGLFISADIKAIEFTPLKNGVRVRSQLET